MIEATHCWEVVEIVDEVGQVGSCHVIPLSDDYPHYMDGDCWCVPEVREDGYWMHNAADGREAYETGERKPH